MKVNGKSFRTIWLAADGWSVEIIDQTQLPHAFTTVRLSSLSEAATAIKSMQVRGAPLIGATAAYGVALAMHTDPSDITLNHACLALSETRPTAVNLKWAIREMKTLLEPLSPRLRRDIAYRRAGEICDDDVTICAAIGDHGLTLLERLWELKGRPSRLNLLTHCNAGWLATVDWGTALAPVYKAHDAGIPIHVWVDETRPRNQGSNLTAWELGQHGVQHTVVADNTGGHLMQCGLVDIVITGTDRTTATGDVCNKIGTYLKALAAHDTGVPFYAALPGPTIDWEIDDGMTDIPIEERDPREVSTIDGRAGDGRIVTISLLPAGSPAANYAFDVTPARLVTGLVTERGVCPASRSGLAGLYPERALRKGA